MKVCQSLRQLELRMLSTQEPESDPLRQRISFSFLIIRSIAFAVEHMQKVYTCMQRRPVNNSCYDCSQFRTSILRSHSRSASQ